MINYTKATLLDVQAMQKLIEPEIKNGTILPRSDDEMSTNIRSYILAKHEDEIVGFLALHIYSTTLAEVRSLIVHEKFRSKKVGSELVSQAVEAGKILGLEEILVLTYANTFFTRLGFNEIPKESLPNHKIWADCIKCNHFPVCNEISLIKTL